SPGLDLVPTPAQTLDRLLAGAVLDRYVPRPAPTRVEALGEGLGMVLWGVDRGLEIEAVVDVREERVQCPLVLLVSAGRAHGEVRLTVSSGERGGERRSRPLA